MLAQPAKLLDLMDPETWTVVDDTALEGGSTYQHLISRGDEAERVVDSAEVTMLLAEIGDSVYVKFPTRPIYRLSSDELRELLTVLDLFPAIRERYGIQDGSDLVGIPH